MKTKIYDTLRIMSRWIQTPNASFRRHNKQYESTGKFEYEKEAGLKNLKEDHINSPEMRVRDLLKLHPEIKTAVDVGSGTGWSSAALTSLVDQVFALEPSAAAIAIAKRAYPDSKYKNIIWIEGFAEAVLPTLSLKTPTIFLTGCVLSHLRDKEVLVICSEIDKIAPPASVFSFAECWGETWHQNMWHIRTENWWREALPNWELEFHGPLHINGQCHMGIWGVKKK